ncbi:MAG: hypothetical protein H6978_04305 [Gammaproteobacteria bacterium]|nr:hypothetical protein [Gammaproteobacteria bacterium]
MKRPATHHRLVGALTLLAMLVCCPAYATSVAQVSFADLIDRAALIFQGNVISHRTQVDLNGRTPWTIVTIEVTDWIKRNDSSRPAVVELPFMGGRLGDRTVAVEGMQIPPPGESGIFFVESRYVRQANPLLGWSQGYFRIEEQDNETVITTADGEPVADVDTSSFAVLPQMSDGTAGGIRKARSREGERAMRAQRFRDRIMQRLERR